MRFISIKISGIILFSFFLFSCSNSESPEIENIEYKKTIGDCANEICINIELEYLKMKGNSSIAQNFNHLIEQFVFQKMTSDEAMDELTPEDYVQKVVQDFQAFKAEFPDAKTGGYEQTTNCELTYQNEKLISVELLSSVYSGGAHPSYLDEFLNIDPNTGNHIDILEFITDRKAFEDFAETELRKKLGMAENDKWGEFTFVEEFNLPINMGMTEKGLRLIYNEYEILPYSDGKTEIMISMQDMKSFSSF